MSGTSFFTRLPRGLVIAIAVAVPVLLIAGVALAALTAGGAPKHRLQALTPSPSPTAEATPSDVPTAVVTTASPLAPAASPTPGASHPPAASASAPAVHAAPTPSATRNPAPPSSAPSPTCQLTLAVTTKGAYTTGETVAMHITEHNAGNAPCDYTAPDGYGNSPRAVIYDAQGSHLWCSDGCGLPHTGGGGTPPQLAPGASASQTYTWNQKNACSPPYNGCNNGQVAPGTYRVDAYWDTPSKVSTSFTIN